jgi:acyl-[acyl carrier protein]--UDP-N-acetylglucosamine O-acyltransferase
MNQPLAYVHPGAKSPKNVVIEPFTTIHNNVVIGDGTWIGSNVNGRRKNRKIAIYFQVQLFLPFTGFKIW